MTQANNVIVLIGRAGGDAELKSINPDLVKAKFTIAVNRTQKDSSGNYITDWINCEVWRKQAELAGQFIKKGTLLSVTGSLKIEKWESNGEKKSMALVSVESFQLLGAKSDSSEGGSSGGYQGGSKSSKRPHDSFMEDDEEVDHPF